MQESSFSVIYGDSETLKFVVTDEGGERYDLSTMTSIALTVKLQFEKPEVVLHKHITLLDPRNDLDQGVVYLDLLPTDTQIAPGRYRFKLEAEKTNVHKTAIGSFVVTSI